MCVKFEELALNDFLTFAFLNYTVADLVIFMFKFNECPK